MRKCKVIIAVFCLSALALAGCGNKEVQGENVVQESESLQESEKVEEAESVQESESAQESESLQESERVEEAENVQESETVQEMESAQESEAVQEEEIKEIPKLEDIEIVDVIPARDTLILYRDSGKIREISYTTKDYYGDEHEITKNAFVYLPHGYDETKQYNVLYLMHGIGGNEREWGMVDSNSRVKAIMDHLIADRVIEPFIVVAVNGRSGADFANTNADYNAFYEFGKELRNDLIPYIDANFATYAEYSAEGYDLTAARDHRAMAGLSMGGMQTTNIGMCECLDIMSYFGAFSAAPTTYDSTKIAECLKNFEDYDVNYYYGICGTDDGIALASAKAAVSGLTDKTDKLSDGVNFTWQTLRGGHDFTIWYLGYYNFARLVFK